MTPTMDCRETRALINASFDGELVGAERRLILDHVAVCAECAAYEKAMGQMKKRVAAVGRNVDKAAPAAVLQRALAAVKAEEDAMAAAAEPAHPARPVQRPRLIYALAAAGFLTAVMFAGISLLSSTETVAASVLNEHRMRLQGGVLDTYANCCRDLEQWFETASGRPVSVPEITYSGVIVQGGKKVLKHETGNEILAVAYLLDGRPITLCVCSGPNVKMPCEGVPVASGGRDAMMVAAEDYTMISWQSGLQVIVLVSPFDEGKTREIFASIR